MDKHFLQSTNWRKFQESLGKPVFEESGDGWSFLATLETTPLGNYLYAPYGPTVQNKTAFQSALEALVRLAETKNAVFIRIEPTHGVEAATLRSAGFRKIKEINPEHTWVLDLAQPKQTILDQMKQNNRNLFNNYTRKGLSVHHTSDPAKITLLTRLLSGVAERNHIHTHASDYFEKQMTEAGATLYYATLPEANTPDHAIAAALVYDSPTTRYYAHAAADYDYRKLSAGTVLLAQMIMDAKSKGLRTFDFYGITTSDNPSHPWAGFTKFKQSFGGSALAYAGTWDLPLRKSRYRAFTVLRATNRRLRRFTAR
jgi:lipid II:glycine glycyltransferase (peptidoglycan interpeptide bridge formation enzyme)